MFKRKPKEKLKKKNTPKCVFVSICVCELLCLILLCDYESCFWFCSLLEGGLCFNELYIFPIFAK